jgi:transcriptional regulator with XRE-family HTH domain
VVVFAHQRSIVPVREAFRHSAQWWRYAAGVNGGGRWARAGEGTGWQMGQDRELPALGLFARELQAARARAGMSLDQLAGEINYSRSLVSHVETCRRVPTLDFARRCDQALGTTGTFERMQQVLRNASFPAWFRPFVEYEARASALRGFEHVLVPGLLQTPEYARAVLAMRPNSTEDQTEELVTARLERQVILDRDQPPLLWVVLDEAALHRDVGDSKIMHDQLTHLATVAERPGVTIQIIPRTAGAHMGLLGAFVIAEFPDAPPVAYLETVAGGQITEEASAVTGVALTFDSLRSEALPWRASRDLMTEVAEERWT